MSAAAQGWRRWLEGGDGSARVAGVTGTTSMELSGPRQGEAAASAAGAVAERGYAAAAATTEAAVGFLP